MSFVDKTFDNTLISRWEQNFITSWEIPVRAMGGDVVHSEEVVLFNVLRPADFFNGALLLASGLSHEDEKFALVEQSIPAAYQPEIWSINPLGDRSSSGWHLYETYALMYCDLPPEVPIHSNLKVKEVESQAEIELFFDVMVRGFNSSDLIGKLPTLDVSVFNPDVFRMFIGYLQDVPVATSTAVYDAGLTGVTYVTTLPEYQRQGIGAVMTAYAGASGGSQPCALVASIQGRPVYERLGYSSIDEYVVVKQKGFVSTQ